jgi:hypothetical protein
VHEEFHHGIKTDGFALFSRHERPPVASLEVIDGMSNMAEPNG